MEPMINNSSAEKPIALVKSLSRSILIVMLIFSSCSESEIKPTKPANKNQSGYIAPTKAPKAECWFYRENKSGKKEKFFGIGQWHIPGYKLSTRADPDKSNEEEFKKRTVGSNIVTIDPRYIKPYMDEKIHMVTNFSAKIHGYLDNIQSLPKGNDKDYYRSQYLKKHAGDPEFSQMLQKGVDELIEDFSQFERAYASIDELALGGIARWFIPPSVGEKISEAVLKKESDAIMFVDLVGHGRGSSYFFEQNYLALESSMPEDPPYHFLSDQNWRNSEIPLLGFFHAYNSTPAYILDKNGNYQYNNMDFEIYKSIWYENLKRIAEGYKNCGNIFSINAFRDFYSHPILSGFTVDALRAGLGDDKPIWLYFDGNGYAKPANISPKEYVELVKCQIYTSIIHGATGIFFWNDWSKTEEVYDALLPVLEELNEDIDIFKMKTLERIVYGDLHIMIKEGDAGERYMVTTNSSKTEGAEIDIPGIRKRTIRPLRVIVEKI